MKAIYKIGYFLILITVLIPISAGYVMQGGLAASWLLWFANYTTQATLLYRFLMLMLQLGTFAGCLLFFHSYVPEKNGELLQFMGTALYMLSPIRFYACYDLADFAVVIFLMCFPLMGWTILKVEQLLKKRKVADSIGYSVTGFLCLALSVVAIALNPVKTDAEMLRERYYINDMFSAFIYRTAHPGLGLGLMLALGLYVWWILVEKNKMKKSEIVVLMVALLGMIAAGCDQNIIYGPLLAMAVGSSCLILLVTGKDYITVDAKECKKYRFWIYGTIVVCLTVGTYICNTLMYYMGPLNS